MFAESPRPRRAPRGRRVTAPALERLEDRTLLSAAYPTVRVLGPAPARAVTPAALPAGFGPAQVRHAYGFDRIALGNGTLAGDGSGQTIAVIDAYDQPNIAGDLAAFDATFGLPAPPAFFKVDQNGGANYPAADQGWGLEISLDVEWARAIAPGANVLLVEANSNNWSDLLAAINFARNQPGVSVVSMSFGGSEWSTESAFDAYFTTPAGHAGVSFVASSGDGGSAAAPEFPSVSPNVLAVGGTQLTADAAGNYLGEVGWSGSGGGISPYEPRPAYQTGIVTQTATQRAVPDVAYAGSPGSPFAVYDSGYGGWIEVYGTSAGAPQWAALVAIADQARATAGLGPLDGPTQLLPLIYSLPPSAFRDVTTGSNGGYAAGPGYDLVTGRGSPVADAVVAALAGTGAFLKPTTTTLSAGSANPSVYGQPVTLTARVAAPGGTPTGTVTFLQGATVLGTGALTNGTAAFTTAALAPGGYAVTAVYGGDTTYAVSTSAPVIRTVLGAGSAVTLSGGPGPAAGPPSVRLTAAVAAVAPGAGTPGGSVTFLNGTTTLGTAGLVGGIASLTTSTLPNAGAAVTAVYGGDDHFKGAASVAVSLAALTTGSGLPAAQTSAAPAVAPGALPMISPLPDQLVAPGGTGTVRFTVGSALFPAQLTVTAASSNPGVLPAAGLALSNTGNFCTLTLAPPAGTATGKATVTVTVADPTGASASASFTAVVDVAPAFAGVAAAATSGVPHDQFPVTLPLRASSAAGNPLTYAATAAATNAPLDLQEHYGFTGVGFYNYGAPAYVLHSGQSGTGFLGYYLLRPDGTVWAYDGSGSYAHSFATAANQVASLDPVVYTDPTLLTGALAPADYAALYNAEQQFQFTGVGYYSFGAPAYVLRSNQPGPGVGGYYLLRPDGELYAYDGSGSYAHSFVNGTPLAALGPAAYADPGELFGAQAPPALYGQLYQLNRQFDLQEYNGGFYTNTYGHQARWLYSPVLNQFGQHWYTLTLSPDGTQALLRAWQGYPDSVVGAVVATLDPSVYGNPQWLTGATLPPDPGVTARVDGSGNLSVALANTGYVGTIEVTVTASDGLLSASQVVSVTSTDTAPTVTVQKGGTTVAAGGSQSFAHGSFPQTFSVSTADAEGDSVTASAAADSYDPLFVLRQQYHFQGLGYYTAGATAYVLQSATANAFGNPYYLLRSDGGLFPYDGSGTYNNTLAGTPLATLGAAAYADPALLTDAQPPVDYATLYAVQQQYQFQPVGYYTAGASAFVLRSSQPGPGVMGYYLLRPDGGLFPYDGSGTYNNTLAGTPLATLGAAAYAGPSLLTGARATPGLYTQLAQVEQRYDFRAVGFYVAGAPACVLQAALNNGFGNPYYLLKSDGSLWAYDGSGSYAHSFANASNRVATLDPSVFADPTLLTGARAPVAATGVTATLAGGVLTVSAPASFVGTFQVTLAATDGILTTTQTFLVTATDTPPVPAAVAAQTVSASGPALQVALGASDPQGDPVTFAAQAVGYSPTFDLQQQYHFQGVGSFTTPDGVTAYVLQVAGTNAFGNPYYLLKSDGSLWAYDGSGSFAHTFASAANRVATLDPSVFADPTLLTNAQPPALPAVRVGVSGNTLTVDASGLTPGAVFQVLVTANDGAESGRTSFRATVTP